MGEQASATSTRTQLLDREDPAVLLARHGHATLLFVAPLFQPTLLRAMTFHDRRLACAVVLATTPPGPGTGTLALTPAPYATAISAAGARRSARKFTWYIPATGPAKYPRELRDNGRADIVARRIPARFGLDPRRDVQVRCPMHRGPADAGNLSLPLQEALTPTGKASPSGATAGGCSGSATR
jgi:hypothetical protein